MISLKSIGDVTSTKLKILKVCGWTQQEQHHLGMKPVLFELHRMKK